MLCSALELSLPAVAWSPSCARREVRRLKLDPCELDAVVMVASELAADAVQHSGLTAQEHFRLVVDIEDDGIVVAVRDAGRRGGPVSRLRRTGGLGWTLIRAVAVDWGCEPGGYSWVRLPRAQ